MHYILVDYENTTLVDFEKIPTEGVKAVLFIGKIQRNRLPFELVEKIHAHAAQVQLLAASGSGKNALDFHIAYFAGRLAFEDPTAKITIVSKDKGFDPLVLHSQENNTQLTRKDTFAAALTGKAPKASKPAKAAKPAKPAKATKATKAAAKTSALKSAPVEAESDEVTDEQIARVVKCLNNLSKNRPQKKRRLLSWIHALFDKKHSDTHTNEIFDRLALQGALIVGENDHITYAA